MKNYKLKIAFSLVTFFLVAIFCTKVFAEEFTLELKGLELAKGIDITRTYRIGTIFAGEAFYRGDPVGIWTAILSHTGTENIEVCGGRGKIITMTLTINFFKTGKQLVLGFRYLRGKEVYWGYQYEDNLEDGSCGLGGIGCDSCSDTILIECDGNYSDIATVAQMNLKKMAGSTLNISSALLTSGRLCHYFPIIPRVYAEIILTIP
jgi:hypothetical protein